MRIFNFCGFCDIFGGISDKRVESDRADSWIDSSDNDLNARVRLLRIECLCSVLGELCEEEDNECRKERCFRMNDLSTA